MDAGIDQFPPPPPPDLSELKISGMAFCYGSVHTAAEGVDEKKAVRFIRLKNLLIVILDVDIKIHIEWSLYIH